ncbi:MAG: winged helix-turn-helix transcriptional regulator [Candidatus Aenigmarchaeota archaeon]|nr:winged helix-turn-helix transcriptional regulator [Candidatus Aenigmarchaeota archaeon]
MSNNGIKEKIAEIVRKNPKGLTIKEIAKAIGIHRINVTKYIYELVGAGVIEERAVGPAKLYYLKAKVKKGD